MESSDFAKIATAFAGGIVVALGGALLFVRTSNVRQRPPVVQTSRVAQEPIAVPQNNAIATPEQTAPHVESVPAPVRKPKQAARKAASAPSPDPDPVLAVTVIPSEPAEKVPAPVTPPVTVPNPEPTGVTSRAVNEDRYQGPQPTAEAQTNPAPLSPPQPHVVTLPAGTSIYIRLGETLSTDHSYSGDTFRATLEQAIVSDGFIIADHGARVLGQIMNSERAGRIQGLSDLNLSLMEISTTDGQQVRITTDSFDKRGPSSKGEDTAKIAAGAALGAIIGALGGGGKGAAIGAGAGGAAGTGAVLVTRGKAATIPAETLMQFRLTNPVTITEKFN